MIASLVVALIASLLVDSCQSVWIPSQEYQYRYTTQTLTGISSINVQYAGLKLSSSVSIQPEDDALRIQILSPKFFQHNAIVNNDGFIDGEEVDLPGNIKIQLESPFTVSHRQGIVEKLYFEAKDTTPIVNLKKALVSQLQNDFERIFSSNNEGSSSVIKNETSSLGTCETLYSVSIIPSYVSMSSKEASICKGRSYYEIIKNRNIANCKESPTVYEQFGSIDKVDGSFSPPSMQTSFTKTLGCGNSSEFTFLRTELRHHVSSSVNEIYESDEKVSISTLSILKLENVVRAGRIISKPKIPQEHTSLTFEYSNDGIDSGESLENIPLAEKTSPSLVYFPSNSTQRQLEEKTVNIILSILNHIELADTADIASLTLNAARSIGQLSLKSLKNVEQTISKQRIKNMNFVEKVFFDLVSMSGTTPSLLLLREKIVSGRVLNDPFTWSLVISNSFRMIQTPTKEIIDDLISLSKTDHIEENAVIRSAFLLGLTDLIHRSYTGSATKRNSFLCKNSKLLCNVDLSSTKNILIPHLVARLSEVNTSDMNSMITFVNALGNLGLDESTSELLKVIEGNIPTNVHIRALAVNQLNRQAMAKPLKFKPIFWSILHNVAEYFEVRIAAITGIISSNPSSIDLQKLALITWFEPSRQVASFIYTTFQSMIKISGTNPEHRSLQMKAEAVLSMVKPISVEKSHSQSHRYSLFISSFKTDVSSLIQWIASNETFVPRTINIKSDLMGVKNKISTVDSSLFLQGSETILSNLIDIYSHLITPGHGPVISKNKREINQLFNTLGINYMNHTMPEAHLTLKYMGLQNLYSLNSNFTNNIKQSVLYDILKQGYKGEFVKLFDQYGSKHFFPTESGLPAYLSYSNPSVNHIKSRLKLDRSSQPFPAVDISMDGFILSQKQLQAGVFSTFTNKNYGAGIEQSVLLRLPVKSKIFYKKGGQLHFTMKRKQNKNMKQDVFFESSNYPFTFIKPLPNTEALNSSNHHVMIRSTLPEQKMQANLGAALGLNLYLNISTESAVILNSTTNWHKIQDVISMFLGKKFSSTSTRKTTINLSHSPEDNKVEEVDFYLSIDIGTWSNKDRALRIKVLNKNIEDEILRVCMKYAPNNIDQCKDEMYAWGKDPSATVVQYCRQKKAIRNQSLRHPEIPHQLYQQCLSERHLCKTEMKYCSIILIQQGASKEDAEHYCNHNIVFCTLKLQSRQIIQKILGRIESGLFLDFGIGATLKGGYHKHPRKIEAQIIISNRAENIQHEKMHISGKLSIDVPTIAKPFDIEIATKTLINKPSFKWNLKEILKANLSYNISINSNYAFSGEERKFLNTSIQLSRSEIQRHSIEKSVEYKRCMAENMDGKLLTHNCKKARERALSLDLLEMSWYIPTAIYEDALMQKIGQHLQQVLNPGYSKMSSWKISQYTKLHVEASLDNMPTGNSIFTRSAPSSCVIESGRVNTFDNMNYIYELNECEHVVFADMTLTPRIVITTRKMPHKQFIKVIVNGHSYEVLIHKIAQNSEATIKVDEQLMRSVSNTMKKSSQLDTYYNLKYNVYSDMDTFLTNYVDGVYSIYSRKYGIEVIADGERLEIKSNPTVFQNRVTGLCGNLNGESVGDLKSPKQCITPSSKYIAQTFVIDNGSCSKASQQVNASLRKAGQSCTLSNNRPTKVKKLLDMLNTAWNSNELKHAIRHVNGKICFSKVPIRQCKASYPKEIVSKRLSFACFVGEEAEELEYMVENDAPIQNLRIKPTAFVETLYEPKRC